jgi:hypothetical protein
MAFAAPIMQRKAVTVNNTAKPLSPMVMGFELEAWLMRILSWAHQSKQPQSRRARFDRDQLGSVGGIGTKPDKHADRIFAPDINYLAEGQSLTTPATRAVGFQALRFRIVDRFTRCCGHNPQAL